MVIWEWILPTVVGAAIGWLTNLFAIRMLFRPKSPVRIGRRWKVQGVIPQRRDDLARVISETVERDLLPMDELLASLDLQRYQTDVVDAVVAHVDQRVERSLPEAIPLHFRRLVSGFARRVVASEASGVVQSVTHRLTDRIRSEVRLGKFVQDKLSRLDTEDLEALVIRVAGRELRFIVVLGAVLGGVIGLAQAALLSLLR